MHVPSDKFRDTELTPLGKGITPKKPPSVKGHIIHKARDEAKHHEAFSQKTLASMDAPVILLANVKKVPYISAEVLQEKLKPGDILLSYYPNQPEIKDAALRAGQKVTKLVTRTSTEDSHNFIHAAMYAGVGKISEAIGSGVVTSHLEGDRFKLKPGMKHSFLVIRPKNEAMAKEAAKIAESLAAKKDESAIIEFSIARAIFSGVRSSELDQEGVKRYLKGAATAHNHVLPVDKNGIRDFFCSYFVGWACQAGESLEVLKRVNKELPDDKQIQFPNISRLPIQKQGEVLEAWAKKTVEEHYDVLKQYIRLDFDPKYTSPQRFYGFVLEHPELFTQEMLIVAPQEEMEMKEMPKKKKAT